MLVSHKHHGQKWEWQHHCNSVGSYQIEKKLCQENCYSCKVEMQKYQKMQDSTLSSMLI